MRRDAPQFVLVFWPRWLSVGCVHVSREKEAIRKGAVPIMREFQFVRVYEQCRVERRRLRVEVK